MPDLHRLSTGVAGLDEILHGGLLPKRAYLIRGGPGSGKTTLGLHFLLAGVAKGEKSLFIGLGEPEAEMRRNAASLKLNLDGIAFLDLSPASSFFAEVESYDIFTPAEVEREPTTQRIVAEIQRIRPTRVFIDSMTQFRYFATEAFQYRKQVLSFLRFLNENGATVLFSSEASTEAPDADLMFLADGILEIAHGADGRTVTVTKFRGSGFRPGRHSVSLGEQGMKVAPRLVPGDHCREFTPDTIRSGIGELDELLGGGLERGTVTILTGPSGAGKTTLGMQFAKEAATRGERTVIYSFEESIPVLLRRCEAVSTPVNRMIEQGTLAVVRVEALQHSADEFAGMVREEVEQRNARIIMIDSVAGYRLALRGQDLVAHLHALTKYLVNMGVTVLVINETETITGEFRATEVGISHLGDNVIFLRFLEMQGQMHKAIGVLKKRLSDFEKTLREFEITPRGIRLGKPLTNLRHVLSGTPDWTAEEG